MLSERAAWMKTEMKDLVVALERDGRWWSRSYSKLSERNETRASLIPASQRSTDSTLLYNVRWINTERWSVPECDEQMWQLDDSSQTRHVGTSSKTTFNLALRERERERERTLLRHVDSGWQCCRQNLNLINRLSNNSGWGCIITN